MSSDFWKIADTKLDSDNLTPRIIIYESITSYNNLNRAQEEKSLIIQEFNRLITYWETMENQLRNIITNYIDNYDGDKIKVLNI